MRVWNSIQLIFTAIGGWIGWYMGGVDGFLIALIVFVALDYLTGVMCAIVNKRLSSEIGAKGIFKKVLIFGLVGLAHMIDKYVLGEGSTFRTATIFFYLSNEGISFLENASRLGLPIPERLKDMLLQLTDKGGKKGAK
ncbi:MAG: Holin family protein [Firmicutes bacterium ADurb.Bin356]|nr:MAG: Holin family protein [Firmicutes bacterium ADurb.Bin356]